MSDVIQREEPSEAREREAPSPSPTEISFSVALAAFRRGARLVMLGTALGTAAAAALAMALPRTYTATARVLPPNASQSGAAALLGGAAINGVAALAAGTSAFRNPSDLYVGILRSDSVLDALVSRFDLAKVYHERYRVDARKALAKDTSIMVDRSGIIAIDVTSRDARAAAELANAYVEQLDQLTRTLALTEASQRRLFFERQLERTKDRLSDAEVRLREAIGTSGLVSVDAQSRATVETVARLRAQISAKEVQIGAMQAYATRSHPEVARAEQEVASLRRALARLETGEERPDDAKHEDPKGISTVRLLREVKYDEAMFELLAKQYELARAEESRDAALVQVLDRAGEPERPSGPPRLLIVISGAVVSAAASLGAAALRERSRKPAPAASSVGA